MICLFLGDLIAFLWLNSGMPSKFVIFMLSMYLYNSKYIYVCIYGEHTSNLLGDFWSHRIQLFEPKLYCKARATWLSYVCSIPDPVGVSQKMFSSDRSEHTPCNHQSWLISVTSNAVCRSWSRGWPGCCQLQAIVYGDPWWFVLGIVVLGRLGPHCDIIGEKSLSPNLPQMVLFHLISRVFSKHV